MSQENNYHDEIDNLLAEPAFEGRRVLDYGFVRLVKYSGSDLDIVRAARVSYDAVWRAGQDDNSDTKLINYLIRNHHTSPFEHVLFTFDVKLPLFVVRQWHRHRTWHFSELSGRYAALKEEFYIPRQRNITTQSKDNKQMRTEEQHLAASHIQTHLKVQSAVSYNLYKELLEIQCPRELARLVLPLNVYTQMFATVDLHNLFHFLRLRLHKHAQWEIRQYARALFQCIRPIVPVAAQAFLTHADPEGALIIDTPESWIPDASTPEL